VRPQWETGIARPAGLVSKKGKTAAKRGWGVDLSSKIQKRSGERGKELTTSIRKKKAVRFRLLSKKMKKK